MNIDISCNECGEDLEGRYDINQDKLRIYPCEKCLKESFNAGCEWQSNFDKAAKKSRRLNRDR